MQGRRSPDQERIASMNRWMKALVLAGLGGVFATGAVMADDHKPRGERGGKGGAVRALAAADANGDKSVTTEEFQQLQAEMFTWMDRDGDGALTVHDRSPIHQRLAAKRDAGAGEGLQGRRGGAQFDIDGNGAISRDEFLNRETPMFDRLDANADGVVTSAEIEAAAAERKERRAARGTR
jgi:hypothetical protein